MIICISGLSGCGKNTVGALVAKKLGLRMVNPTFKTLAAREHMTLMEFHKKAEGEHSIDRKFDEELKRQARGGNCVVTTWLGPWMIKNADIRVWLHAPREVRARRIAGRDSMTDEEALHHITERDEENHRRYMDVYKIDIYDHSIFDILINTEKSAPEHSARIIVAAALGKETTSKKKASVKKTGTKKKAKGKTAKKKIKKKK